MPVSRGFSTTYRRCIPVIGFGILLAAMHLLTSIDFVQFPLRDLRRQFEASQLSTGKLVQQAAWTYRPFLNFTRTARSMSTLYTSTQVWQPTSLSSEAMEPSSKSPTPYTIFSPAHTWTPASPRTTDATTKAFRTTLYISSHAQEPTSATDVALLAPANAASDSSVATEDRTLPPLVAMLMFGPNNQWRGAIEAAALAIVLGRPLGLLPFASHFTDPDHEDERPMTWQVNETLDLEALGRVIPQGLLHGPALEERVRGLYPREIVLSNSQRCGLRLADFKDVQQLECSGEKNDVAQTFRTSMQKFGTLNSLNEAVSREMVQPELVCMQDNFITAAGQRTCFDRLDVHELPILGSFEQFNGCWKVRGSPQAMEDGQARCDAELQSALLKASSQALPARYIRDLAESLRRGTWLARSRQYLSIHLRFKDKCVMYGGESFELCYKGMTVDRFAAKLLEFRDCTALSQIFVATQPAMLKTLWPQVVSALRRKEGARKYPAKFWTLPDLIAQAGLSDKVLRDFHLSMLEQEIVASSVAVMHGLGKMPSSWLMGPESWEQGGLATLDVFTGEVCAGYGKDCVASPRERCALLRHLGQQGRNGTRPNRSEMKPS